MSDHIVNGRALALGDENAEASSSSAMAQDNVVASTDAGDMVDDNAGDIGHLGDDNVDVAGGSDTSDTDVESPGIDYSSLVVDKHGRKLEKTTPREDFKSHMAYMIYCMAADPKTGETDHVKVCFGKDISDNSTATPTISVSKKLLLDASPVLRAAFRTDFFLEGQTNSISINDTEPEIFGRLYCTLQAGGSCIGALGRSGGLDGDVEELTALIKTYKLADFYQMSEAAQWISDNIKDVHDLMLWRWAATARGIAMTAERTGGFPTADYNLRQQQRLMDISKAYDLVMEMEYGTRPIQGSTLVELALRCCPTQVLVDSIPDLGREFLDHLFRAHLSNRIQT